MPDINWEAAYFEQQLKLAEKLGCAAHPNNIDFAIRDLQARAAGGDRKRARRRSRIKAALIKSLKAEGATAEEIAFVDSDLDRIVCRLVKP